MDDVMQHGPRAIVVVMGVSGAGKSSLGRALAERLGVDFLEGDAAHPPANVAKMRAGEPLDDADREPWLGALAVELRGRSTAGQGVVLACSALKRAYRDRLRQGAPDARFVHLVAPRAVLERRLRERPDHYMPASLVASQLDALEPPVAEEGAIELSGELPQARQLAEVARALGVPTRAGSA